MQSITKIKLSQDTVAQLLCHHFGVAVQLQAMQELEEGFFNTAYRLDLADGCKWVLKAGPPPHVQLLQYERDIMDVEVSVMRLLHEHTSLPVPAIHCYDKSGTLVENEFYIMDYLPGEPLHQVRKQLPPEAQFEIDRQFGSYLREVNAITGEGFGYYASCMPRFQSWRAAFDWMIQRLLEDGQARNVELPLPYPELYERLQAHFPYLEEVTTPRLVLWDGWDGNIFIDREAHTITGIIDYERSLWGDPLMEMSFGFYNAEGGFPAGYGQPMLATPAQQGRRTLYNIYLFLIMVIECYYRQYPHDGQEKWARQKLAEELEQLQ